MEAQSMRVTVRIPAPIRRLYGAQACEQMHAQTIADVIAGLEQRYPGMGERLRESDGQIRRWVNLFIDGVDIRERQGVHTVLPAGAEVYIVPALAGGA